MMQRIFLGGFLLGLRVEKIFETDSRGLGCAMHVGLLAGCGHGVRNDVRNFLFRGAGRERELLVVALTPR